MKPAIEPILELREVPMRTEKVITFPPESVNHADPA